MSNSPKKPLQVPVALSPVVSDVIMGKRFFKAVRNQLDAQRRVLARRRHNQRLGIGC